MVWGFTDSLQDQSIASLLFCCFIYQRSDQQQQQQQQQQQNNNKNETHYSTLAKRFK